MSDIVMVGLLAGCPPMDLCGGSTLIGGPSGGGSVWVLCERLRAEKLMVTSELDAVRQLHVSIEERLHELGLLAWNTRLHQWTLHRLLASDPSIQPDSTFSVLATLNAAQLEPAYRRLGHHHSTVASALNLLLSYPTVTSELLHAVDSLAATEDSPLLSTESLCRSLFSLVYGHCIFPSDEAALVEVLCSLMHLQLASHANPRLVLRRGTAAFPRLYRLFTEGLYSVKVFLTEALHDSVMLVLCQDDSFLDIDANKSVLRFPPSERARRFGSDPTSAGYEKRLAAHRRDVVEKLVLLTLSFVKGIVDSLHSLPPSLVWLIQQLHAVLVDKKKMTHEQASLICTDLLVTNLLCTAITNPETIGVISDTPVSNVARFNLMQVGQLVQILALSRYEPPPAAYQMFTRQFEESPLIGVVDRVLSLRLPSLESGSSVYDAALSSSLAPHLRDDPIRRAHFIGSIADVNTIVAALSSPATNQLSDASMRRELSSLAKRLPPSPFTSREKATSPQGGQRPIGSGGTLRNLAEKMQTAASVRARPSSSQGRGEDGGGGGGGDGKTGSLPAEIVDVVVFTIGDENEDKIGLQPEEAFMETARMRRTHRNSEGNEKRARFVEDDQSNIGSAPSECTTEGGSDTGEEEEDDGESMDSSSDQHDERNDRLLMLDEDGASTLPDNVSEMGAMSGRATPSLSGRETPDGAESTIAAAGDASTLQNGAAEVAAREALMPRLPVTVRKQNAEGLEDKFGKFSLPRNPAYRDDQRSLLSDSWSTDVVPSDNEGPVLQLPPLVPQPAPPMGDQLLPGGHGGGAAGHQGGSGGGGGGGGSHPRAGRSGSLRNGSTAGGEDRSDTWSLDAIASDSEADRNERSDCTQNAGGGRGGGGGGSTVNNQARVEVPQGGQSDDPPRMRRQSSGSSFYSEFGREEDGRRPSLGNNLPLSKPTSEAGEDAPSSSSSHPPLPEQPEQGSNKGSMSPPMLPREGTAEERPLVTGTPTGVEGLGMEGISLKDKLSSEVRSGKAAIWRGLHRIGDKMKRNGSSPSMRPSATVGDFGSVERELRAEGRGAEERVAESRSTDALNQVTESADDILAKYKRVADPSGGLPPRGSNQMHHQQPVVLVDFSDSTDHLAEAPLEMAPAAPVQSPPRPYYSPDNVTTCAAFGDAKRKLRFVLSGVGFLPTWYATREKGRLTANGQGGQMEDGAKEELVALLQVLLAEAVNGRERALCAQIREAIRCLEVFTQRDVRKLLRSLKEDHRRRASYTLYLQQSRLSLLRLQAALSRLTARVAREKSLTEECLVEMWCTRFYLPNRQASVLEHFDAQFARLHAQDEKTDWVERHMASLWSQLESAAIFRPANATHREYARKCIERSVMARIYHIAFYPNADADIHRDDLFHKALARLSSVVTPNHKMMSIPEALLGECPWPSAQHEIAVINAYRSPRDKLACVSRACETIANLLALTSCGPAAADDVTPILVYVLIMANPPALLSNVQYVEGFFSKEMTGSDAYWWTQFTAAIEYIKTLL